MAIVATHVAAVQELYVAYFGRPADVAGLDYWTNVVADQGGSTTAVSASFATQPEYIVQYFGKTNAQVVDQIYANMFGRASSNTDGRSYWVNLLNEGKVGISTIVAEVANGAQGADADSVENKVAAATAFTAALDTEAEQAGYNGTSALALAKAFITGVTTDATLTNATAPEALAATVAGVVKAGTPFSLDASVDTLNDAREALADFLEDNDLDALADADAVEAALDEEIGDAAVLVAGFDFAAAEVDLAGFDGERASVQAVLIADAEEALAKELSDSQTALATARAAASAGVRAIADNLAGANVAFDEAEEAAAEAVLTQNAAVDFVEARTGTRAISIVYNTETVTETDEDTGEETEVEVATSDVKTVTIAAGGTDAAAVVLINENRAGNLQLASSSITEAKYPGVTALLEALRANQDAQLDLDAATEAQADALTEYSATGTAGAPSAAAKAIVDRSADVAAAREAIDDLAELVADWEEAVALKDEYENLNDDVAAAVKSFTDNSYVAPSFLDAATKAATSGSDIFLLDSDTDAVTISSFGRSGNDTIFVGSAFKFNEGDLEDGDNAALEVFFVQNGTRAEIHVENAAYGSDSDDVTVITLIGVNADDLVFNSGVITVNPNA